MFDFEQEVYYKLKYMGMRFSVQTNESLNNYFFKGLMPGGHLEAMLAHDLERALYNADTANRQSYWGLAMWIRECAPEGSHGSYGAIEDWCKDVDNCRSRWATWYELNKTDEVKDYEF